jgi:hypothetical protein
VAFAITLTMIAIRNTGVRIRRSQAQDAGSVYHRIRRFMKNCRSYLPGISFAAVIVALLMSLSSGPALHAESRQNLVVGGDGEAGLCSDDPAAVTTVPGWIVLKGDPSLRCYAAEHFVLPRQGSSGKSFFAGGPYGDSALKQVIDVSSAHETVDTGSTMYTFAGWLGGQGTNPGGVIATAAFLDAQGRVLKQPVTLPAVTAAERRNASALLERRISNRLPSGTRSIAITLQFAGRIGHARGGCADNLSFSLSTPIKAPVLEIPASTVPGFDHVFLVMMENTTYRDVIGDRRNAPYINHLADRGTLLTNATATYHPSDENYLMIAGGAPFVRGGVYFPNVKVKAAHIGDELESAGKTWKGYEQGMGTACGTSTQYDRYFEPDDLPFINFTNIRDNFQRCQAHLVDMSELAGDLRSPGTTPAFAWLAADDYDDGEASYNEGGLVRSLQVQDAWLRKTLDPLFASPAWTSQRSLLILTWDESYETHENHIATILIGSNGTVRAGYESALRANHYSIARTLEEALGIPPLTSNDRYARPLNEAFPQSAAQSAPGRE